VVENARDLHGVFPIARAEALASFGDGTLYVEKLLGHARHIEVQVIGDGLGGAVHFGERNCSIQRRHQKILEEAPSPGLSADVATLLHQAALAGVHALKYRSAGTFEFLLDAEGRFYFMEINARIQVEHPVTEQITGIDLVKLQIQSAFDNRLDVRQRDVSLHGHAIECRINAEDPDHDFLPQPGTIEHLRWPGGFGVRVDSHVFEGYTIPIYYDSLIAKIVSHGLTRADAIATMARALDELEIGPGATTTRFLRKVLEHSDFLAGDYTLELGRELTHALEEEEEEEA
jgi:acetyl-CoA carboxylase biotin carboxylase subunit